jgi:poly(3-hydroxybutyrate) depolymerase
LLIVSFKFLYLINTKDTYNVDKSKITVSGISSGAAMANQLHVAYSSVFSGVGIVAGRKH